MKKSKVLAVVMAAITLYWGIGFTWDNPQDYTDYNLRTANPGTREGRVYYNATSNVFKFYDGVTWVSILSSAFTGDITMTGNFTLIGKINADYTEVTTASDPTRYYDFRVDINGTQTAASDGLACLYGRANWMYGNNSNVLLHGVEGVASSAAADESVTLRGGYFRTYVNANADAPGSTARTNIGCDVSARAGYPGGDAVNAEGGSAFVGLRIWMAPYFASTAGINNFHGLWIYNEHATNAVTNAIKIESAGGGFTNDIVLQNGEIIDNAVNGSIRFVGDVVISGDLNVTQTSSVDLDQVVLGNVSVGGNITTTGSITSLGDLYVDDDVTVTGALTVTSTITGINVTSGADPGHTHTDASVSLTKIQDADTDTKIQVEESADEDIIRFDTGGTEHLTIDDTNNMVYTDTNLTSNIVSGLTLNNGTLSTLDVPEQNSPALFLKDHAWSTTASVDRQMGWKIVSFPTSSTTAIDSLKYYSNANGVDTLHPFFLNTSGQTIHLATGIGESLSAKFIGIYNSTAATNSVDQYSSPIKFYSQGWKANATAGSQYMSLSMYNAPEQGSVSPIGVHKWSYGTNTGTPTEANELLRVQWGSDAGVLGAIFNEQSINDYTFRVETDTVSDAFVVNGASDRVDINVDVAITGDVTITGKLTVTGSIDPTAIEFSGCTTAAVANNSIFLDTADNKLKTKDNSGTVAEIGSGTGSGDTVSGIISGMECTFDTVHTISISAGVYCDDTGTKVSFTAVDVSITDTIVSDIVYIYVTGSSTISADITEPVLNADGVYVDATGTGYYVSQVIMDASGTITPFVANGDEYWVDSTNMSVLTPGNADTWTDVDCSGVVPVTAEMIHISGYIPLGLTNKYVQFRPDGLLPAAAYSFTYYKHVADDYGILFSIPSVNETFEYKASVAENSAYLFVSGFRTKRPRGSL